VAVYRAEMFQFNSSWHAVVAIGQPSADRYCTVTGFELINNSNCPTLSSFYAQSQTRPLSGRDAT